MPGLYYRKSVGFLVALVVAATTVFTLNLTNGTGAVPSAGGDAPALMPWTSVGGCGAGGGAGGSSSEILWIGQGVSGALLDVETRLILEAYSTQPRGGPSEPLAISVPVKINIHPRIFDFTLAVPLMYKGHGVSGNGTTPPAVGIGDLRLILSKRFGMTGKLQISATGALPTGRYDIHNLDHQLVSGAGQLGTGLFGGTLALDYSFDREWGLILAGASYSATLFGMATTAWQWDTSLVRGVSVDKHLVLARESFGARNDMGFLVPDYVSAHCFTGIKREKSYMSFGITGSVPTRDGSYKTYEHLFESEASFLGEGWTPEQFRDRGMMQTYIDTARNSFSPQEMKYPANDTIAHTLLALDETNAANVQWAIRKESTVIDKIWPSVFISYGMEFSDLRRPVFWGIGIPVEFDLDEGVGVRGFSAQLGLRFMGF